MEIVSDYDRAIIDSCLNIYHESRAEEEQIKAIDFLIENCWGQEVWPKYNNWLHDYAKAKLKLKSTAENKKMYQSMLSTAWNNKGYLADQLGQSEWALKYYNNSLKIDKEMGDQGGVAQLKNNMGGVYLKQGKIKEALTNFQKSLEIREEINDSIGISQSLANIAAVYDDQGESDKTLEYLLRCITYVNKDDYSRLGFFYNNIASVYSSRKEYSVAYDYYKQSLAMAKSIGNLRGYAQTLANVGALIRISEVIECSLTKDECLIFRAELALKNYLEGLEIFKNINDKIGQASILNNIGSLYSILGNDNKAEIYLKESYDLARAVGYPEPIKDASRMLSEIYEREGLYNKSLSHFKVYIEMRDSVKNEATQKATIQQQAKYEYEKQKVLDDAENEKLIAIEKEEKEKQQILTYATAGGLGLVVIFLVFVFNRLRITKKQKLVIEQQKQEVETQKEVVELAHSELEEKNQEIMDSITYAKRIQSAILPPAKVVKEYLQESFILYKPKDIVAGDFYWLEHIKGKVLFAAADCTGHGVPGAMVSVVCNNALNRTVREYGFTDPGEILNKTREIVVAEFEKSDEEVKDGMDIALCSLEGKKLQYAGAHNPLWIIRKGELLETKANKQPIGQFDNPEPYTTHSIELQKGDSIYIFSDGYVDQFGGEKGKKFKGKAFRELLISIQDNKMEEQKIIIDETFETWRGELEQIDDVCVIGVRV